MEARARDDVNHRSTADSAAPAAVAVVKVGGALVSEDLSVFWDSVRTLAEAQPVIVVHGGGPEATRVARLLGHEPEIVHGRRVTTARDLEIMEWVARGALNSRMVGAALAHGIRAVGLSGVDGGIINVSRRPPWNIDGREVDFGFVGDVRHVDPLLISVLLASGFTPVVAPLGVDQSGQVYNVNADTVARALAEAVGASSLLLVTESGGLRADGPGNGSVLPRCDMATFESGTAAGWITGGMRVKLQVAFEALHSGVRDVCIVGPDDLLRRARATKVVE